MTRTAPWQWLGSAPEIRVMGLFFVVAMAVRLAALSISLPSPDPDERLYLRLAESIASGEGFTRGDGRGLESHYGPLLPYLIAAGRRAGLDLAASGRAVSAVAGSLAVALAFLVASRVWGRNGAVVAGLAALTHMGAISASRHIYPEAISSVCLLGAAFGLLSKRFSGIIVGLSLGMAVLARREALLLFPIALLLLVVRPESDDSTVGESKQRRLRNLGLALLAFGALVAPYVLFLRQATGHWTLSGELRFAFFLGRLMETRSSESVVEWSEIHELENRYATVGDYVLDRPVETVAGLSRTTAFHAIASFFQRRTWPWGLAGLFGLAIAIHRRRIDLWRTAVICSPFALCFAWSLAGPYLRYSRAMALFVAIFAGGWASWNESRKEIR